ncbi:MAG: hypothetical protein K2K31_03730 [Clostridia bacterium]|nr:hypothetical protein [Clostridia bacterium]
MKEEYNDEMMPDNFETLAKAYSKSLKNKGFVFISLEEEEFRLLLGEILVIIAKMQACLKKLDKTMDSGLLKERLCEAQKLLCEKFDYKKPHKMKCVENENKAFLNLISLENLLILKTMLLSVKSGELELCNQIITAISSVFAESFTVEGFVVLD